jgi:putative FmdB family regulatory protein
MPRYDYKCKECGAHEIIAHSFYADEQHECLMETCNGIMHKVISPTPTHFKTGGFYSTDNR